MTKIEIATSLPPWNSAAAITMLARSASVEEVLRVASGWIERFHEGNRDELSRMARWYTVACVALGIEIVLWTISLSDRLSV